MKNTPTFNQRADSASGLTRLPAAIKPALQLVSRQRALSQMPRLFTEGLAPIKRLLAQAHNQSTIQRLIDANMPVHFVSSFPRSGSTWTRHLMADVLLQVLGHETETELPVPLAALVPDFYCEFIDDKFTAERFVKTHDRFDQLRTRFCKEADQSAVTNVSLRFIRNSRILYLYRSPEDVLVSFYHFQRNAPFLRRSNLSIDDFCLEQTAHWISHVESYLCAGGQGVAVFFLSYERLLLNPVEVLCEVLRWLKIQHTAEMVEAAVAHMHFEKMRAMAERRTSEACEFFWRRGREGAGRVELRPDVLKEIQRRTASTYATVTEIAAQRQGSAGWPIPDSPTESELLQRRIA